ncbi:MAG: hypothetical protein R2687_03780 [Candidatus Nanopelagicales bacterium]
MDATFGLFKHPEISAPTGIIEGPGGEVWFTSIGNNRLGRVCADGVVQTFADPAGELLLPANLYPGSDGRMWFTALGSNAVGSIDPSAADPATTIELVTHPGLQKPVAIKGDEAGHLWCTLRGADAVARIDPAEPVPVVFEDPSIADPSALFIAAHRVFWVNARTSTIGWLAPDTGEVAAVDPGCGTLRAWAIGEDGRLWLTTREPAGLLVLDPTRPTDFHWVAGDGLSAPDGVWQTRGILWIADTDANAIVAYDPSANTWERLGEPPAVDGPFDIKAATEGSLWFTNKTGNSIGRMTVV